MAEASFNEEDEEFVTAKTNFLLAGCRGFAGNLSDGLKQSTNRYKMNLT